MKELAWKLIARFLSQPAVAGWLVERAKKTPYSPIWKNGVLYMERNWLFNPYPLTDADRAKQTWLSKKLPSARIHVIHQRDTDRDKHSHPWDSRTIILDNAYIEERRTGWREVDGKWVHDYTTRYRRQRGDTATLTPADYHRIVELEGDKPVTTLFITWEYAAKWGFLVEGKHIPWRQYLGLDKDKK